jgi:alcohol dehydrogenase class IV
MTSRIVLPRVLEVGGGASGKLAELLASLGLARPLVVTDAYMVRSGVAERVTAPLLAAGFSFEIFADTVEDPTTDVICAGLERMQGGFDCVVGLGGGSPIDTAKAMAVLAVHGGAMRDYKAPRQLDLPGLPIIAIPTTAGTGSEATRFTVVTDTETDEKMLCAGLAFLPTAALVDYELTLTKPRRLTADTGIDALTHAIEAYVSRRANSFADGMALQAMAAIARQIETACDEPQDRAAREAMMLAATQAGIAFSNSSVALVHGMSRPIGAHFHVPHGLSNAMLLPLVTRWSAPSALHRYADCARAMDLADETEGDQSAVAKLVGRLDELNAHLNVPTMSRFGMDEARYRKLIPLMVEQALASGSPGNNPRVPAPPELAELYEQAWA